MVPVERWEVVYPDGATEMFDDEALARTAQQLAGGQLRHRMIEVPAVYRLWDPVAKEWVGGEYATVQKAAAARVAAPGTQVRLVPSSA